MYQRLVWIDHQIDPTRTYTMVDNGDGTVKLTPYGTIVQQGTNLAAVNFNNVEEGVLANSIAAMEAARLIRLMDDTVDGINDNVDDLSDTVDNLSGTVDELGVTVNSLGMFNQEATLTNSFEYPFNNSQTTIAFDSSNIRSDTDYTVTIEVESYEGGFVGDIVISDKMLNGFKLEYRGSASSVTFKIYVQGGK